MYTNKLMLAAQVAAASNVNDEQDNYEQVANDIVQAVTNFKIDVDSEEFCNLRSDFDYYLSNELD